MSVEIQVLKRKFEIEINGKPIYLDDPNPEMSIEEVSEFYSNHYPQLMNSIHTTNELDGNLIIKFKSIVTGKDRKSTRLNSSHSAKSRMPSSA